MDDWGKAPSVQRMRKIFSMMEQIDDALIKSLGISPFEPRLRDIRDMSRELFEKSFTHCISKGISPDEKTTIELFKQCHITAFKKYGISVPGQEEPEDNQISNIIREVME